MPKKIRAILEDELVDGVIVKKGEVFETEIADYLLNRYADRRELVEEDEEVKVEKKAEKKVSKKK